MNDTDSVKSFTLLTGFIQNGTFYTERLLLLFYFFSPPSQAEATHILPPIEIIGIPSYSDAEKDMHQYEADDATSGSRVNMPIKDIPQTIDVRTEKFIKDIAGQQRIDEVSKYVPGINITWYGNGGTNTPIWNIRGFSNSSSYNDTDFLKDGYRKFSGIITNIDLANVQRIEYLKGPSSVIYGASNNLGGMVNFISKRPLPSQQQHIDFTPGSFDFSRITMDVGTPLNEQKSNLFRMNAAFQDGKSFRDFAWNQSFLFAPSFTFDITENDRVDVLLDYNEARFLPEFGIPITDRFADVPREHYLQDPNYDHTETSNLNGLIEYNHKFNDDWAIKTGLSTSRNKATQAYTRFYHSKRAGEAIDPLFQGIDVDLIATRDPHYETDTRYTQNIELTISGRADLLGMEHNLMLGGGFIYNHQTSSNIQANQSDQPQSLQFNILSPTFSRDYIFKGPQGINKVNTDNFTFYAQDLITLIPQLKIMLGMRYDHIHQKVKANNYYGSTGALKQTDERVTPRFGIIYQPFDSTSLYGSYTTSFAQRTNFFFSSPYVPFKPEIGEQYEVGLKQKLNDNLDFTMALFQLTRKNVVQPRPGASNPIDAIQTNRQRSRGVEFSLTGNITDDIRIIGAYTFLKANVLEDNVLPKGTERVGVPQHTLGLFGVYSFPDVFKGLEIGSGVHYTSTAQVYMPNIFKLPSTIQWDALIGYRFNPKYKIQINVNNITDEKNYIVAEDFGYLSANSPRSVFATFSADF